MRKSRRTLANDDDACPARLDDGARGRAAARRYFDTLGELFAQAEAGRHVQILADNLAYTIARIGCEYGSGATGDVLRRIGDYMQKIEARRRAGQEADQAKQEGRLPH